MNGRQMAELMLPYLPYKLFVSWQGAPANSPSLNEAA
jgi:hypothetical protein